MDRKMTPALDSAIFLLDVGHHSLEEVMMQEMQERLSRTLEVETFFVASDTPFRPALAQLG